MDKELRLETGGNKVSKELFYLQDKRQYVGNDMLWWAKKSGYTTDVSKAQLFSKEEALIHTNNRSTDIPWPKEYIDRRTRPVIDMQEVKCVEHEQSLMEMRGMFNKDVEKQEKEV